MPQAVGPQGVSAPVVVARQLLGPLVHVGRFKGGGAFEAITARVCLSVFDMSAHVVGRIESRTSGHPRNCRVSVVGVVPAPFSTDFPAAIPPWTMSPPCVESFRNRIAGVGGAALAGLIVRGSPLEVVDLDSNCIGDEGARAWDVAVKKSISLQSYVASGYCTRCLHRMPCCQLVCSCSLTSVLLLFDTTSLFPPPPRS